MIYFQDGAPAGTTVLLIVDDQAAEMVDLGGLVRQQQGGSVELHQDRRSGDAVAGAEPGAIVDRGVGPAQGAAELGTVHPTSLARSPGIARPVLLLRGRSWEVIEVDWPRRRVSVVPAEGGGRSRWLGSGRTLSARTSHAAERIDRRWRR